MREVNLFEDNGAEFSKDRQYRYALWRIWDKHRGKRIMFIGLNPSTANETDPDPTITRVKNFTESWGYSGFYMLNLFAIVSDDPKVLKTHADPLGDNNGWLEKIAPLCDKVVFAWGAFKQKAVKERAKQIIEMFPEAYCLKKTKDGSPWHPLYMKGDTQLIKFNG